MLYKDSYIITNIHITELNKLCETIVFKHTATYPCTVGQIQEILINNLNKKDVYF